MMSGAFGSLRYRELALTCFKDAFKMGGIGGPLEEDLGSDCEVAFGVGK
jgi:hypothetical protein